jgi:hypothetical protein
MLTSQPIFAAGLSILESMTGKFVIFRTGCRPLNDTFGLPSGSGGTAVSIRILGIRSVCQVILCLFAVYVVVPFCSPQSRDATLDRLLFSALDREEKPVLGLSPEDFALRIGGKTMEIQDFRPGLPYTDMSIPLVAWILIDFSPSVDSEMLVHQSHAAASFFSLIHPDSVVGVKIVSDRSETLAPLAHDPEAVRKAFVDFSQRRYELRAGTVNPQVVGDGGMVRALELAIDEMSAVIQVAPSLREREVHRAIMLLSGGNINPAYSGLRLYRMAAFAKVFLYPVFTPALRYGPWLRDYFALGELSGGVASVLGALNPGSKFLPLPRGSTQENALTFNFIHMIRDLNGKYSIAVPAAGLGRGKLELRCRVKGVRVRIPRESVY